MPGADVTRVAAARVDAGSQEHWLRWRLGLALIGVVTMASAFVLHERSATLQDLYRGVEARRIGEVRVTGGLEPGSDGYSVQEVRWRERGLPRLAELVVGTEGEVVPGDIEGERTGDDVAAEVHRRDAAVFVSHEPFRSGLSGELLGRRLPGWIVLVLLAHTFASLLLLVVGPKPWRATRWAWFWLSLPPFMPTVFLLLSGPSPGIPAPRSDRRRMTGGWALLLSLLIAAVLPG